MADFDVKTVDKTVPWYQEKPREGQIKPEAIKLLETYAHIPPDQIMDHVQKLQEQAWEVFPYPCIGQYRFLRLSLMDMEVYPMVVQRLKEGAKLLDIGCCFGQELRQLVADGAPPENLYGSELRPEYIELGYKLFNDRDKLQTRFLTADVFDPQSALTELRGGLDFIYAGAFFHLWGYDDQFKVSKIVASLLKPEPGSMILARQVGAANPKEVSKGEYRMFQHSDESIKELWKKVGEELGVSFEVEAKLTPAEGVHIGYISDDSRRLWFTVKRV